MQFTILNEVYDCAFLGMIAYRHAPPPMVPRSLRACDVLFVLVEFL